MRKKKIILSYRRRDTRTKKGSFIGESGLSKLNFSISLTLQILEKRLAINSKSKPNLYNIFRNTITSIRETIEQLSVSNNYAIWVTRDRLLNVKMISTYNYLNKL